MNTLLKIFIPSAIVKTKQQDIHLLKSSLDIPNLKQENGMFQLMKNERIPKQQNEY